MKILFINKTATSGKLSQSQGKEKSRIFSHVQRSYTNGSRKSPSDDSESASLPRSPSSATELSNSSEGERTISRRENRDVARRRKSRVKKVQSKVEEVRSPLLLSPLDTLLTTHGDPFDCLAVPFDPYMEYLFKFYSSDVTARVFPTRSYATTSQTQIISLAFQDVLLQQTLLSTVSAALFCVNGDARHGVSAMGFKGRALKELHNTLQKTDRTVSSMSSAYAVSLLLWVECVQGNLDDLRAHSAGLQQLVNRASDLESSPLCILVNVLASCYLCSAILDVPPNIEPGIIYDDAQLSEPIEAAVNGIKQSGSTTTAPRLLNSSNVALLGPCLTRLAQEQQKVMVLREVYRNKELSPTNGDIRYLYCKQLSVEYELSMLRFDSTMTPVQDAIRLIMFIFPCQAVIYVTKPSAAFSRIMAKRLRGLLEETDMSQSWAPCTDLLLWILFVGSFISFGEADWPWYRAQLWTTISALGLKSADEMSDLLKGYYYFPEFMDFTLRAVWEGRG